MKAITTMDMAVRAVGLAVGELKSMRPAEPEAMSWL